MEQEVRLRLFPRPGGSFIEPSIGEVLIVDGKRWYAHRIEYENRTLRQGDERVYNPATAYAVLRPYVEWLEG